MAVTYLIPHVLVLIIVNSKFCLFWLVIDLLGTLSGISILLPALAFLFIPLPATRSTTMLKYFIFGSVAFELIFTITSFLGIYNVTLSYPYALFEAILLISFFLFFFHTPQKARGWVLGIYTLLFFADSFFVEPLNTFVSFNPIARSFNGLIIVVFAFLYFYRIYQQEKITFLEREPSFWFVSGLLLYFSTSFFTFLFSAELFTLANDKIETSWFFHSISNLAKNGLITVGIWVGKR